MDNTLIPNAIPFPTPSIPYAPRRRSTARVEIWRHEVATATAATLSPRSSLTSPAVSASSTIFSSRPTSSISSGRKRGWGFSRGMKGPKRRGEDKEAPVLGQPDEEGEFPFPDEEQANDGERMGLLARVKRSLIGLGLKSRGAGSERTGMYHGDDENGEGDRIGMAQVLEKVTAHREARAANVDVDLETGSEMSADKALAAKNARLQRAARLLEMHD